MQILQIVITLSHPGALHDTLRETVFLKVTAKQQRNQRQARTDFK